MAHEASTARRFSKMMIEGRMRTALSDNSDTGLLGPKTSCKTVRDVLEEKHPDPRPADP